MRVLLWLPVLKRGIEAADVLGPTVASFFSPSKRERVSASVRWQQWVKESLSSDDRVAARSRLALALRVLGVVMGFSCIASMAGGQWPISLLLGLTTLLMGGLIVRLDRGACPRALSKIMLIAVTVLFTLAPIWDGELYSISLYLVPILPLLGLFVLGRRVGVICAFVALAVTIGVPAYFGVEVRDAPFLNQTEVWLPARLIALGLTTCFGVLSAALSERHVYRIERSRRELKMQVERVYQARLAKKEFLATMSHEIRTPMNGVLGMTQLLARSKSLSNPRLAGNMHRWAEQLLALLNRVLELAKIDSPNFDNAGEEVELAAFLERFVETRRVQARSKGIELAFKLDLESCAVSIAPTHLERALDLLLDNALEHSNATRLELGVRQDPDRPEGLVLTLSDDGQGLHDRLREQVQDVLHRGHHLIEGKGDGSGLGIVAAHRLLVALGAQLDLEDKPGCAWAIWIPSSSSQQDQISAEPVDDPVDLQVKARQTKLSVYIALAFVSGLAYLVQSILTDRPWGTFVGAVVISAEVTAFVLNRYPKHSRLASWVFLSAVWFECVVMSCADGQLHSATLWLIPTCPLMAATLLGMRASLYSGIASALGIVGVCAVARFVTFQSEFAGAPEQLAVFRVVLLLLFASLALVADKISRNLATALTAQHKELTLGQKDAEAADEETTRFLDAMSRKIGEPMREILSAARMLGNNHVSKKDRQMLDTIKRSGRHLLVLMNETMEISRADSSIVELQDQSFCLNELVADVERLFSPKAELSGLTLETVVPKERIEVVADVTKLLQILCNLVGNAVKFSHRGTISVVLEAPSQPSVEGLPGRMVSLSVQDQGVGISEAEQLKIFEDYVQLGASYSKSAEGGTGLGLSICSKLAKLMGGSIELHSEVGQGARFTLNVWLPDALDLDSSTPALSTTIDAAVLIVDDNAINRRVAQASLEALGVAVVLAESGAAALGLARQQHFELVLMDLQMPGLSGFETIARLQEMPQGPRHIVALSADYSEQDLDELKALGIQDRLAKPMPQAQLEEILEKAGLVYTTAA